MACIELCGGVHTAQRQTPVLIGFCVNILVSVSVSVAVCVNAPLRFSVIVQITQILSGLVRFTVVAHLKLIIPAWNTD